MGPVGDFRFDAAEFYRKLEKFSPYQIEGMAVPSMEMAMNPVEAEIERNTPIQTGLTAAMVNRKTTFDRKAGAIMHGVGWDFGFYSKAKANGDTDGMALGKAAYLRALFLEFGTRYPKRRKAGAKRASRTKRGFRQKPTPIVRTALWKHRNAVMNELRRQMIDRIETKWQRA